MIANLNKRKLNSILGLALDGSRLEGALLRRTNGSAEVQKTFSAVLTLDPLTAEAELVGREIRNHLDAAGIKEKACVMGLPLKWALTTNIEVPQAAEADVDSFLQLEAERSFHSDVSTLHYGASRANLEGGRQQALLAGIPRAHLIAIERALESAKLKPLSFAFSLPALQPPAADSKDGVLAFSVGETAIGLEITACGGVAALRTIEGALRAEGTRRAIDAEMITREARITLGQLPHELRESIRTIRVFGPRDLAQQLADELELRFESMRMKIEVTTKYDRDDFGFHLPSDIAVSPATSLAAGVLAGRKPPFELLPPRISHWQHLATRYASGKLSTVGFAAAGILLIVLLAFIVQQIQLSRLRSKWSGMSAKVKQLDGLEGQIRQYRPWYDDNFRALAILRQLTSAFPEDGVVSAKTVEIRDLNVITCTGTTRDQQALLKALERLRASRNITGVRAGPIRGNKPPLQFTFDFHWSEGGEN